MWLQSLFVGILSAFHQKSVVRTCHIWIINEDIVNMDWGLLFFFLCAFWFQWWSQKMGPSLWLLHSLVTMKVLVSLSSYNCFRCLLLVVQYLVWNKRYSWFLLFFFFLVIWVLFCSHSNACFNQLFKIETISFYQKLLKRHTMELNAVMEAHLVQLLFVMMK